jgi:hypothetical protein
MCLRFLPFIFHIIALVDTNLSDRARPQSLPYVIFPRFAGFPSSSSSGAFFFLLFTNEPLFAPFDVGWLDSRVGKEDVGVGASDGVVPAEAGVDVSCMLHQHLYLT